MHDSDKDFQAAHEIGKIYNSFVEKSLLCDFFIESTLAFCHADQGFLFLAGNQDKLWLESGSPEPQASAEIEQEAADAFIKGKPVQKSHLLLLPLIVRNGAIGIACFVKTEGAENFTEKDFSLAFDLASQLASALKNILLFEQNLKMERLAAIGQTMSMVLHEIKNIIQIAKFAEGYLSLGLQEKNEKFLTKGVNAIIKVIKEMDGFTYEMLSLTKDYQISPEIISMPALLAELKEDLRPRAEQYKVELDFQAEEGFPQIEGESRSLFRALLNLVKNAIEAADGDKPKSFVRIRVVSIDENTYDIRVEDNGRGMSDEAKAKIFQAFFSTKGERGTGLGLLVIDRTVKAHHGKIQVESQAGQGTSFILTLPKVLPKTA